MAERCLVVSADLPWPPDGGGRIASLGVIEVLASEFDVDLVALYDPAVNRDPGRLREICHSVSLVPQPFTYGRHQARQLAVALRTTASSEPYRIAKFRNRRLSEEIDAHLQQNRYALLHYEQFGVTPYHRAGYPTTLSHQNVETDLYRLGSRRAAGNLRRLWADIEGRKLRRYEPAACQRFDRVFVLSRHDQHILELMHVDRVTVIPVPVMPPTSAAVPPETHRILTLGTMSWFGVEDGLLWFHRTVWPLVRARVNDAEWVLAGANPTGRIMGLAADPAITVLGHVEDADAVRQTARVLVVPVFVGGGVRVKILESMAQGRPFVATAEGAMGLAIGPGQGGFVANDPAVFADAVVGLMTDDERWRSVGDRGREFVTREFSPENARRAILDGVARAITHYQLGSDR